MNLAGVYAIVNRHTDRCYIGRSANIPKRWRYHLSFLRQGRHQNQELQAAWTESGEAAFVWQIVELVHDHAVCIEREQHYLRLAVNPYNTSSLTGTGPKPGRKQSAEAVEKQRAAMRGRTCSPEHRARMSAARRGRTFPKHAAVLRGRKASDETRAKMSASHKALPRRSSETCARLSSALKGRVFTPKHRAAISAAKRGQPHTPEPRARIAEGTRRYFANRAALPLTCLFSLEAQHAEN